MRDQDRAFEIEARLVSIAMNEPVAAREHLARLDRIDEELAGDSRGARMMLCHLAYWRMWRAADATRSAQLVARALANDALLSEVGSDAAELNSAAMTLICADRLERSARLLDTALANARMEGSRAGFALISFLRSMLSYRRGMLHDVEADAHGLLGIASSSQLPLGAAVGTALMLAALLERGAVNEAAKALTASGVAEGELPPQTPYNLVLSCRGRLRIARGEVAAGLADLRECGRRNAVLELRNPVFIPWRDDAARALAEDERTAADRWGTPGAIGVALRLAGLLRFPATTAGAATDGSTGEAISLLQQAAAALAESPARLEHARALVDLGAALRRANRRGQAREPLIHGLDLADRCGALMLRQRAHDELAAIGARPRRARVTGVDALTASERRVAQMAAAGLGNVEIAQTLFVTRKTVEKHLGNAYAKLGVSSRAELGEHFPDPGGLT